MARIPAPAESPKIKKALLVYQIMAWITGAFLLLLVVEMVLKYVYGLEFTTGYEGQLISLVPSAVIDTSGLPNISLIIQITHGYIYIFYLISSFLLVNWLRWPIMRFIVIALGGVVPLLSFFVEHRISRQVKEVLAQVNTAETTPSAE